MSEKEKTTLKDAIEFLKQQGNRFKGGVNATCSPIETTDANTTVKALETLSFWNFPRPPAADLIVDASTSLSSEKDDVKLTYNPNDSLVDQWSAWSKRIDECLAKKGLKQ